MRKYILKHPLAQKKKYQRNTRKEEPPSDLKGGIESTSVGLPPPINPSKPNSQEMIDHSHKKLTKGKGTRRKVSISQQCLKIVVDSDLRIFDILKFSCILICTFLKCLNCLAFRFAHSGCIQLLFAPWMRSILFADDHTGGDQESKGGAEEENHSRNLVAFLISTFLGD